jgi:Holliday junction resolvase RusA-like endonuclease
MYMTADGKALKEDYQWQAKAQWRDKPLAERLKLTATLFFKTKRTHDVDNYSKLFLDALTGIVWEDDVQIQEMTVRKGHDRQYPRIEVTVVESGS